MTLDLLSNLINVLLLSLTLYFYYKTSKKINNFEKVLSFVIKNPVLARRRLKQNNSKSIIDITHSTK